MKIKIIFWQIKETCVNSKIWSRKNKMSLGQEIAKFDFFISPKDINMKTFTTGMEAEHMLFSSHDFSSLFRLLLHSLSIDKITHFMYLLI